MQENDRGHLYCIDDFSFQVSFQTLFNNLSTCGVEDRVTIKSGKSNEVIWPEHIDFAFIDGDHSFEGCQYDVECAIEKGAYCITIHDTKEWPGPRDFLKKFRQEKRAKNWDILEVSFDQGLAILLRKE